MSKFIDLSYTIEDDMPVHLYDDKMKLYQNKFLNKDKFNDTRLEMGMHVGTHIDVPSHLLDCNNLISDYQVEKFIGKGCFLDVRNEMILNMKDVYQEQVEENDIVILYTGHGNLFKEKTYFTNHPIIGKELAEFFIKKGIKMVGIDAPSPDLFPFKIHHMFLENDILIIENLANLESLVGVDKFEVIAFPLKIKAEASPARVVAKII